ncbi:MAG TPA: hypothetical protein PLH18_06765 [Clostridia bacterium]|nr:hypothetical protein [Clostridia bacterium]
MAFFKKTYDCFMKRPFLIIYIAVVSLIYSVIQLFNPLIGLLQNLGAIRSDSWADSMIYISKELYTPANLLILLPIAGLACVILAVVSGIVTSGYLNVYHETLMGSKEKTWVLVLDGLKKAAIKVSLVFLQFYVSFTVFIMLIPIASVPSIILKQKALENGSQNIFINDVLPILTIAVFAISAVFIAMAFIFRFPAIYYFKKRPVERSKTVTATAYWRFFGLSAILIALVFLNEYMLLGINGKVPEFIVGFITHAILLVLISVVSLSGFNAIMGKFKKPS